MRSNYEVKLFARKSRDEVIWYTMNCSLQETIVWIHKMLFLAIKHLISNYFYTIQPINSNIESIHFFQWDKTIPQCFNEQMRYNFKVSDAKIFLSPLWKKSFNFAWFRKEKLHVLCIMDRLGNGIHYKHFIIYVYV